VVVVEEFAAAQLLSKPAVAPFEVSTHEPARVVGQHPPGQAGGDRALGCEPHHLVNDLPPKHSVEQILPEALDHQRMQGSVESTGKAILGVEL
jgi:hypothetical protein